MFNDNNVILDKCTLLIAKGYDTNYVNELYETNDIEQVNEHLLNEISIKQ